ncbi:MAG TPA: IS66 family transposase [Anaerolineales bacterium]|nr:IS66 family transposase [Anaerolineales bacterium]
MSQRRKRTLHPSETKDQQISELQEQLSQALEIIRKQQKQIERLEQRVQQQQEELEYLKRIGKRQATPFARRHWVERLRRPGRKAGKGRFTHRELPQVVKIHETKEAKLHGCPACGSRLKAIRKQEQFVTDIPVVEVKTTHFVTYSGYCTACHKRVRSQHPEQTSLATGAAGVMVGPRAKALAADLKHRLGVSYGKVSEVLNDAFGLQVSRSGWCQADQKLARTARPVYEELLEAIRQCSVVNADETGWRIGTLSAWLWVFTHPEVTVYTIRANRSSDVVLDMLGTHFSGVLTSDGHLAYDDRRLSDWLKQQCLSHLLRDLKEMNETKTGRALHFARQATRLLQEALALKREKPTLTSRTFSQRARSLEVRLDLLIDSQRRLSDRDNARFAKRLRKHRPHLLRFLYVDDLEATNNLAERMLRPAVITRKTNGCNRTKHGAQAHSVLASVLVTCHQHSIPVLDYLVQLQQFGSSPPSLLQR